MQRFEIVFKDSCCMLKIYMILKVKRGFRVKIHDFGSRLCQLFDWQLGSDYIFILPYYLDNDIHTLTYQASESNMANNSHIEGAKITIFFSKSH